MIRFQRIGRTNDASFRIVAVEKARAAKSGRVLAQVGTYNPRSHALTLDAESVKGWIGKGAQPTASVHNLLLKNGVIEGQKMNAVRRKNIVKPVEAEAPAAAVPAAEAAPEASPAAEPSEAVAAQEGAA
jgi:small subunit ribosomal protein S16